MLPGITEGGPFTGDGNGNIGQVYPEHETHMSDLVVDADAADANLGVVRNVVPGDIYYHDGHLAIVQSVVYQDDGWAEVGRIRLIESTYGIDPEGESPTVLSVISNRSIASHYADDAWRLVRLRSR